MSWLHLTRTPRHQNVSSLKTSLTHFAAVYSVLYCSTLIYVKRTISTPSLESLKKDSITKRNALLYQITWCFFSPEPAPSPSWFYERSRMVLQVMQKHGVINKFFVTSRHRTEMVVSTTNLANKYRIWRWLHNQVRGVNCCILGQNVFSNIRDTAISGNATVSISPRQTEETLVTNLKLLR